MRAVYVCQHENCGKSYVNNSILKRHIQAFHNAQKRFQCTHCGKCLASRQNLKEHSYTHTGEKPYKCPHPGCGCTFRQGTHLSAHKRLEHGEGQPGLEARPEILELDLMSLTRLLCVEQKDTCVESEVKSELIQLRPITGPYICSIPNLFS